MLKAIGNTPVIRLSRVVSSTDADVVVKLETLNPTGSYKDRMELAMIEGAETRGTLRPGMWVVEFTGGSTGSSLAMVCAAKGYRFVVLSSDAFAREKLLTMEALEAELRMVPSDGGQVTPALFDRFRKEIAVLASEPDTFWTDQFHNQDAVRGYMGIGQSCSSRPADESTRSVAPRWYRRDVARRLSCSARSCSSRPNRGARACVVTGADRGPRRASPRRGHRHWQRPAAHAGSAVRRSSRHRRSRCPDDGTATRTRRGFTGGHVECPEHLRSVTARARVGTRKTVATVAVDTGLKYLAGDLFVAPS